MSVRSVFPFSVVFQSATPADRTSHRSSSVVGACAARARVRADVAQCAAGACVLVCGRGAMRCKQEGIRPAEKRVGTLDKKKALRACFEATAVSPPLPRPPSPSTSSARMSAARGAAAAVTATSPALPWCDIGGATGGPSWAATSGVAAVVAATPLPALPAPMVRGGKRYGTVAPWALDPSEATGASSGTMVRGGAAAESGKSHQVSRQSCDQCASEQRRRTTTPQHSWPWGTRRSPRSKVGADAENMQNVAMKTASGRSVGARVGCTTCQKLVVPANVEISGTGALGVGRGHGWARVSESRRVCRGGNQAKRNSLLELSIENAEAHGQVLRRERQDIGNFAGGSAEREQWHAAREELRLRVGTDVDDVLPDALPPLLVRNRRKDSHDARAIRPAL